MPHGIRTSGPDKQAEERHRVRPKNSAHCSHEASSDPDDQLPSQCHVRLNARMRRPSASGRLRPDCRAAIRAPHGTTASALILWPILRIRERPLVSIADTGRTVPESPFDPPPPTPSLDRPGTPSPPRLSPHDRLTPCTRLRARSVHDATALPHPLAHRGRPARARPHRAALLPALRSLADGAARATGSTRSGRSYRATTGRTRSTYDLRQYTKDGRR